MLWYERCLIMPISKREYERLAAVVGAKHDEYQIAIRVNHQGTVLAAGDAWVDPRRRIDGDPFGARRVVASSSSCRQTGRRHCRSVGHRDATALAPLSPIAVKDVAAGVMPRRWILKQIEKAADRGRE